jgi:photosystem II stability/assembly factor-like uncharacterized protein
VECLTDPGSQSSPARTYIYTTDDASGSWTIAPYPGGELTFVTQTLGWAIDDGIHQTADGGKSWDLRADPPWHGRFDFVSAQTGWAAAEIRAQHELLFTEDGGATWTGLDPVIVP